MENSSTKQDRLSDLPDGLLLRIISLASLGARELVKTILVSRRWRHLWREVPHLEIDPREFQLQESAAAAATTHHSKRDKRDPAKEWDRFEKFTENLLSRHSPELPLHTLVLHVANPPPQGHGRRNPSDAGRLVRLCLERCCPVKLDVRSYSSETPVDLHGLGREIDLTRLTTLHLSKVILRAGFAHHLGASACPRLEHLQLNACGIGFTELVLSRTLKTLSVSYSTYNAHWPSSRWGSVTRTRIEAPGLVGMTMEEIDGVMFDFHVPSLVEASVFLLDRGVEDEPEMLCGLRNARILELSRLPSIDQVPKFGNLRKLILGEGDLTGQLCTTLDLFMHAAPNLEELSVRNCQFGLSPDHCVPCEGQGDLRMFHNLRTLHLDNCDLTSRSSGEAPTLLEYLLQNAPNLEKLTL